MDTNRELYDGILRGDRDSVRSLVQEAVDGNVPVVELLNSSMIPPLHDLGNLYAQEKILLPDLLVGARAMRAGIDVIGPLLGKLNHKKGVKICIGTVKGDQHDIGKSVVAMIARAAGYEVDDLGADCGVDAYGEDAAEAVRILNGFFGMT